MPSCLRSGSDLQLALHRCRADPGLELRAQPLDLAAKLFLGALAIEGDETGEKIVVRKVGGPAIGGEDGTVEIIVQTLEHADQAAVVDAALGLA